MSDRVPGKEVEYLLAHIIQDFMQFMHDTGLSRPQIHALLHIYHAEECQVSDMGALSELTGPPKCRMPICYIGDPSPDPGGSHPGSEPNNNFRSRWLRLSYGTFRRLATGLP